MTGYFLIPVSACASSSINQYSLRRLKLRANQLQRNFALRVFPWCYYYQSDALFARHNIISVIGNVNVQDTRFIKLPTGCVCNRLTLSILFTSLIIRMVSDNIHQAALRLFSAAVLQGFYLQYRNANLLQHGAAMNEARAAREMEALDPFRNRELAVVAHACGIRHFTFPAKSSAGS